MTPRIEALRARAQTATLAVVVAAESLAESLQGARPDDTIQDYAHLVRDLSLALGRLHVAEGRVRRAEAEGEQNA